MKTSKHRKNDYKKTAEHFGVTPKEVEMEISEAIKAAYNQPEGSAAKEFFTSLFPHGKLPSNKEFIEIMAARCVDETIED